MGLKTDLVERRKELDAKRKQLSDAFKEAGSDLDMDKVSVFEGDSAAKAKQFRTLHDEINDLGIKVDEMVATIKAASSADEYDPEREAYQRKGFQHTGEKETRREHQGKSLGAMFAESPALKGKTGPVGPTHEFDIDVKTLMTTSAGWAPETSRNRPTIDFVTTPIDFLDSVPTGTTDSTALTYMEETTFTNNAAEVAEAGTYPEAALALTERTDPVRKIAVWLPVTDEQLEDISGIQSYIDNRLTFMLRQRMQLQVLSGDGTAPNLSGILDRSGLQTQAKGADPTPDAIYKAMTLIMLSGSGNGGANANFIAMHPLDWQDIRLLRTTDGIYIWGSPADPGVARIWGVPVTPTQSLTAGTAVVGDSNYMELAYKRGIELQVTNSHSDFFINGKQAIRADVRAALAIYRAAAFCSVTGI